MAQKNYFEPVNSKEDFPAMERELLKYWYDNGIVQKYLEKNKNSKEYFSFLDGPITANNPMGVHHAWGRTYKDLWQRYNSMLGKRQRHQNGFDCQGLWVEVEVEKALNLKSKKEIENLVPGDRKASIAKFVEMCKKRVFKYADIQTEQSKRLGYFADWENSYYTLSEDNNYMIWRFIKKCHEKGLIYKGQDVVPWCPRCETAISEHEMLTEDYNEVTHESVFFRLPIKGKDEYLLVWTTTPWTIPTNVAVSVDPGMDYSLVKAEENKYYWVAKDAALRVFGQGNFKVVSTVEGKKLVGLAYEAPFDELPIVKEFIRNNPDKFHKVVPTNSLIMPISADEGTGLVHTATGTGAQDFKIGKELSLPVLEAIDDSANYLDGFGFLSGKNAKENPNLVIDHLREYKEGKYLYRTHSYAHRYPGCWRCKAELVWKLAEEWYIAIDPVREKMKSVTKNIQWIPGFGLKRELDWLNNMHDWLISKKNRYWGLALPIWECKNCGSFDVIGSKEELEERSVSGYDEFKGNTPHKPWIDAVEIKCSTCSETTKRIDDVGNPWLDAGIVAYSTISKDNNAANPNAQGEPLYLADKEEWEKWFPADFITESFPGQFKNWFYSLIAMSTVLEGREPFKTVLGFATLLAEDGRPMHKSWGNSIEFNEGADKIGVDVMRWMYARQNPKENLYFGYKVADETRRRFHLKLWNIYNFFVTYANLDRWEPKKDAGNLKNVNNQLDNWIISRFAQTKNAVTDKLNHYDAYTASSEIETFVDDMSNWYIRRSRKRLGVTAENDNDKESFYSTAFYILANLAKLLAPFTPFMSEVIYKNLTKEESVHLAKWPIEDIEIDEKLLRDTATIREVVEKAHAQRKSLSIPVRQPLKKIMIKCPSLVIDEALLDQLKEEVNVMETVWDEGTELSVSLDTNITPALASQGEARNIIRMIQKERKDKGVKLDELVTVYLPQWPKSHEEEIKAKALVSNINKGEFKIEKS